MACNGNPVCEICFEEFNDTTVIPLILECNDSFCKSCVEQRIQMGLGCTKCQKVINTNPKDLPVNLSLLLVPTLDTDENYFLELKSPDLPTHISELYALLSNRTEETEDSDDQSVSPNYPLVNIEKPRKIFQSIYNKVKKGERIYTFSYISNKRRFGKISTHENMVLFHCLDLKTIPEKSSIIMFSRIKEDLLNFGKFRAFIKFNSKEGYSKLAIIEILKNKKKGLTNQFLHYCTGEDGQSYKNFVQLGLLNRAGFCCEFEGCEKLVHVVTEPRISLYDREFEDDDYEDKIPENKMKIVPDYTVFLEHFYMKGWLSLIANFTILEEKILLGRVISPDNLYCFLYNTHVSDVKILDSGLAVRV